MKTIRLTAKDFTVQYPRVYSGEELDYNINLEIESNLGWVRFNQINVAGYICAEAGTGIEAGEGIKAGWDFEAGTGVEAGWGIKAGEDIKAGWGIKAGEDIKAEWGVYRDWETDRKSTRLNSSH